jgi:DNA polymerase III alpha subunit (gram-positive type)
MHTKLIFLDTETTGLQALRSGEPYHEIIELAALVLDDSMRLKSIIDNKYKMRRPGWASPRALDINKYNAQIWEHTGLDWTYDTVGQLVALLQQPCVLVGHNINFDVRFLRALIIGEFGFEWRVPPCIDTRALARLTWGYECLRMDTIRKKQGWSMSGAHSAAKDAIDCYRIYQSFVSSLCSAPIPFVVDDV